MCLFMFALFLVPHILISIFSGNDARNRRNHTEHLKMQRKDNEPQTELMKIKKKLLNLINEQGHIKYSPVDEFMSLSITSMVFGKFNLIFSIFYQLNMFFLCSSASLVIVAACYSCVQLNATEKVIYLT